MKTSFFVHNVEPCLTEQYCNYYTHIIIMKAWQYKIFSHNLYKVEWFSGNRRVEFADDSSN